MSHYFCIFKDKINQSFMNASIINSYFKFIYEYLGNIFNFYGYH